MKPYGLRKYDDLTWEFGPQSKERKHTSKFRKEWRRLLHKQGRNDSKKETKDAIEDS